jgi:hypothetical protein
MTQLANTFQPAPFHGALRRGVLGLFAVLAAGCTQTPLCEELEACGGNFPLGVWELRPGDGSASCSEDLYAPTVDTRLKDSEVPAARTPPLEPALFDWCNLLVAGGGEEIFLNPAQFYYESGRIGQATITYNPDGTFSAGLTRTGTFKLDFPATCMRAFGASDGKSVNPDDPAAPIGDVCKQLEVPLAASGAGEGSYRNTTCQATAEGGCECWFDVTETGGPVGRYRQVDQNTIIHYASTNFPATVSFCNKGNRLLLTGADGAYLYNFPGLRSLNLALVGGTM